MGITVVLVVSICGNNSRCVIYFIYCYQVSACKKKTGVRYLQRMGHKSQLILQTTGSFMPVSMVAPDFKLFGNLLYAGYLSIYF